MVSFAARQRLNDMPGGLEVLQTNPAQETFQIKTGGGEDQQGEGHAVLVAEPVGHIFLQAAFFENSPHQPGVQNGVISIRQSCQRYRAENPLVFHLKVSGGSLFIHKLGIVTALTYMETVVLAVSGVFEYQESMQHFVIEAIAGDNNRVFHRANVLVKQCRGFQVKAIKRLSDMLFVDACALGVVVWQSLVNILVSRLHPPVAQTEGGGRPVPETIIQGRQWVGAFQCNQWSLLFLSTPYLSQGAIQFRSR